MPDQQAARKQAKDDKPRRPPRLQVQHIIVRAKANAMVYTVDGNIIPNDNWVAVPLSPDVVIAIKAGDLEEAEEDKTEPARKSEQPATGAASKPPSAPPPSPPKAAA